MTKKEKLIRELSVALSYILVAVAAVVVTLAVTAGSKGTIVFPGTSKLSELQKLLETYYIDIDKVEMTKVEDAAANAMIEALGDRWSYYVTADEYAQLQEQNANSYVGIGITITSREDKNGFTITKVEPGGSAKDAGILPGDILIGAEGQRFVDVDTSACGEIIRGKAGTKVTVTVIRDGEELSFTLTRKVIKTEVAVGKMLPGNIGLVSIKNFNDRCASEAIAAIESLKEQGATSLIFDVRNNPGGYKHELVKLLDYLLPEGKLFISKDYTGKESTDRSNAKCLEMPMTVLVNENSYSAAEFFAAALEEYDWATVVGAPTCGKGNFQVTFQLSDGSGVGLSIGKYYTPNGVSLADVGGLVPKHLVEISEELAAKIYAELVPPEEDPQIQEAVKILTEGTE
ncbi:MAG: PDZ domain-containing protein [Ruminococcaceae bacterium]|nr:PDZ domain-containing protein [Oscillospiraceae bacterium]